jgi:glycosyltransferase involved in cell wall biosynthesis
MSYPNEASFVIEVLSILKTLVGEFTFSIYADDGGAAYAAFAKRFRDLGIEVETRPYMSYANFLDSLEEVAVGLAPLIDTDGFSGGKSFGKILAYLDRGVPVVTHPVVDHPLFFRNGTNGFMVTTARQWAETIARLLADPDLRQEIADNARNDFQSRLSIDVAADRVDAVLNRVLGR